MIHCVLLGLLALSGFAAADRTLSSVTTSAQTSNVSISFAPAGGKGSAPIDLSDPRLVPTGGAEQVRLTNYWEEALLGIPKLFTLRL